MSSLKVFISSSVYVTIDPGTSSIVTSPFCLVDLCLAIFWAVFIGFVVFSLSPAKEAFYASPRICSSVQNKEEPPAPFKKTLLFVFNSSKGDNGFDNIVKLHNRKPCLQLLC